jgi:multimeric flavodoxin WrbA
MSKIVVLVGSMRKGGNTDLLAQAFTEGASKNNDVEIVSVADYKNEALKEAYEFGLSIG